MRTATDISTNPILAAALDYAANGVPVFPCRAGNECEKHWKTGEPVERFAKSPYPSNGFKAASTFANVVERFWTDHPAALIGMPTGARSGVFVLDVDPRHGGDESLSALEAEHGALPETRLARSASGGRHFHFRFVEGVRNNADRLGRGLDIRGDGGYIIVPGSVMADGTYYEWLADIPPADAPQWLVNLILPLRHDNDNTAPAPDIVSAGDNRRYCEAAIAAELKRLASATNGERNTQLNRSAFALGQFVGAGALSHAAAAAQLAAVAAAWGEGQKSRDTIERGLRDGERSPRQIPAPRETVTVGVGLPDEDDAPSKSNKVSADNLTEDDVARLFADTYAGKLRFCHSTGAWFDWVDTHWRRNETGLAAHYVRLIARDLSVGHTGKTKAAVRKRSFSSGVETFARNDPTFAVTITAWDSDPFLLGTPGGTVDLRTGKMRRADPADGVTKLTAVAPSVQADCPLWLKFLDESTGGDTELVRFLRQWCGYCLTGDTREHALVFVHGDGGNGKSVFLNTVAYILSDYATTASMDTFVASRNDRHPTDLAMLRGARLVTASETEEGRAWAESRIKQMTGGDPITARFMRQDFFTFQPQFKLFIVGNHQPALHSVDTAARRRFNIVPFTRKPARPDRELEAKLRGEAPAILRWMIAGCMDWQTSGLVRPASIVEATETYFAEQDVFGQWLKDCCRVEPDNRSISDFVADLFKSWTEYAEASGERAGSKKAFVQSLTKGGFQKGQRVRGGQLYTGLQLLKPAADRESARD